MTAETILAATDPRKVLGEDPKRGFHELAREWHPDRCSHPKATAVLAKLTELRDIAAGKRERATPLLSGSMAWGMDGVRITYPAHDGKGVAHGLRQLGRCHENVAKRLPKIIDAKANEIYLSRPKDGVPLQDVLDKYPGGVKDVHVAWIVSRLYELVAHTHNRAQMVCLGIVPDAIMVLKKAHGVLPLDWRFLTAEGQRVKELPGVSSCSS